MLMGCTANTSHPAGNEGRKPAVSWRSLVAAPPPTYAPVVAPSPQTLSVDDRRIVASWAADCAEHVLGLYEDAVPDDIRVRAAIDQTRAFASGELNVRDAVRHRGGEAGAAAREAPTPAAKAAAYAAEQAAAVAHMGAHAFGAAGYAAKASTLAAGCDDDAVTRSEALRQVAVLSDAVARALASLPNLGENRSGPIGPGRLSGGHVGETIRVIQAQLCQRERALAQDAIPPSLKCRWGTGPRTRRR
jgi:hypothetical protein